MDGIIARRRGSRAVSDGISRETAMERLNLIDSKGRARMGGLLVAGAYPQQFFPRLLIDVAVHPGIEKSQPGLPRFLDRALCDGPMPEAVEDAVGAVARNLRTVSMVKGVGRHDELEIPLGVLREAIVNAVVHREYHPPFQGQTVNVDVYPDRVTITSPGGRGAAKHSTISLMVSPAAATPH